MTDMHFAPTKKKIDSMSCNNVIKKMRLEMETFFNISILNSTGS